MIGIAINPFISVAATGLTPPRGQDMPPAGYAFLAGKAADGSRVVLRIRRSDGSLVSLAGKVS
ncbi:nicotinamide mononucleotide (NMN) deamidase PncC [Ancylobacter sp. 3268]|uniref:hypothetical protein n=1 Tax=Ancylobacter sp. 3268 TaxID=2817752 RepID=UPI0028563314|nr:hypothetical protein [Ancylobacter sp. 3268]MDR6952695.1 nicotinamide mononucleotide (NMN) deamidase PncC [Ancylobacter sp. 3268]